MLTLTLSTLGLPLEGVGLLLAIDPIIDMIRTATNVAGQMVVPVIVARSEKVLDRGVYDAAPQPLEAESAFGGGDAPREGAPSGKTEPALQPA